MLLCRYFLSRPLPLCASRRLPLVLDMTADLAAPEARAAATSELKYLLDKEGVEAGIQDRLFQAGVTSIKMFAVLAEDIGDLEGMAEKELGISTAEGGLKARVQLGAIKVAWQSAHARAGKVAEADAERETRMEPKLVAGSEFSAMLRAFELAHGKLEHARIPARAYVERICDVVERAEFRAEPLSEVVNFETAEADTLKAS